MGYNVGCGHFGEGSGNLTYSAALGISLTDTFGIYVEPFGNLVDFQTLEAGFDAGITYLLKDNCQFDFSFGTGINHTMNYLSVGCSIQILKEK